MSLDENIKNAFYVVRQTYDNVDKLLRFIKTQAFKYGYVSVVDPFLRWRNDNQTDGWLIDDFILLFQKESDDELSSGLRDGHVYTVEIDFKDVPCLYVGRYEYPRIREWTSGFGKSHHWAFYHPFHNSESFSIEARQGTILSRPRNEKVENTYWGLARAFVKKDTFTDITAENIKQKIFDEMDALGEIE